MYEWNVLVLVLIFIDEIACLIYVIEFPEFIVETSKLSLIFEEKVNKIQVYAKGYGHQIPI